MKKKFLVLFSALLVSSFGFMGCFEDEKSTTTSFTAPAAETVTLADIQGTSPTGTGITPANKIETTAAVDNLMTVSDDITSAIGDVVIPSSKGVVKSFKQSMVKSIAKSKAPVTESDEVTWDEDGVVGNPPFYSGSAAWVSKGAYSWSDTWDIATGAFSGANSFNSSFKVQLAGVIPSSNTNITLNGILNENIVESFNNSGTFSDTELTSMNFSGNLGFSHRSGYSISGSEYKAYIVISCDLTASVSVSLNSTQLAQMTDSEYSEYVDNQSVLSGSMTVTVYDATRTQVFQQVYTADEVWNMGE